MWKRAAVLGLCLIGLTGCILQSDQPLFSDKDSTLALGDKSGAAKLESFDKGEWVAEKDPVTITVKDHHYEALSEKSTVILHFVSLGGNDYVLQGSEDGKSSSYLIAEVKDGVALVRALACTDLKKDGRVSDRIKYDGDNCSIAPGTPALQLFKTIAETKGEFTSRLAILPQ